MAPSPSAAPDATPFVDVRPASSRFHTDVGWLDSHHSFSFGQHHDPDNIGHGLLIVSNDDIVAPGTGFSTHPHRDMEIVTWVLDGELEHADSEGNKGVIYPGLAQRMTAGSGIWHSEMNHSKTDPVHFVQMWVVPDTAGVKPGYAQSDVNDLLAEGGLVPVATGRGDGAISFQQAGASLYVGRLTAGERVDLPEAPFAHLFVARGDVELEGRRLGAGDAVRLSGGGYPDLSAVADAEVILWASDGTVAR